MGNNKFYILNEHAMKTNALQCKTAPLILDVLAESLSPYFKL